MEQPEYNDEESSVERIIREIESAMKNITMVLNRDIPGNYQSIPRKKHSSSI